MLDTDTSLPRGAAYEKTPTDKVHNELRIGDLYTAAHSEESDCPPIFRLLHKNQQLDKAWVIQLPTTRAAKSHVKSPVTLPLSELVLLWRNRQIVSVQITEPPIFSMNDDEIRGIYTNKDGRCPILEHRNRCYQILESLISQHSSAEILEKGLVTEWVKKQAALTKKSAAKIYNILHSYWAGNFSKNALLPDYWRSGGKGQEREQRRKLGRPNSKVRAEGTENNGYFLCEADKKKLHLGWRYFLKEGRTRPQAYLETMAAFYSERVEIQDGKRVPILLHPDLRPTIVQFETWGPAGDPHLTASRIQLGEIEWAKKNRGIPGSAKDGIVAVGMQAVCDTTTNDAYLKSVTSRLKTVGPVNRLLITESRSEIIIGLHCGFDPPSAKTFLLAVAHGASSKVDFCDRYGIKIAEEDWPACAARTYLGDNGEYRNQLSQEALSQFGSSIDNIPSGQPQFNGVAESKHHVIHSRLDHTLDGTTYGKPRRRGQAHPAINACVNYYEYMRELISEILYHNNQEQVPHLLTAEMRRDSVKPTRIAIYRWLITKGYVVDFTPDLEKLRAHLYPSFPATLTESGVYLLRENAANRDERIPNVRYMGDWLVKLGLLEQARSKGNRRITVRCDPTDPRSAWIQTELGLKELQNIHPDPILYRQAPLADLITIKDEDKVLELESRGHEEQERVTIIVKRRAMLSQAQAEKSSEMAAANKKLSKQDHCAGIEKNKKDEISWLAAHPNQPSSNERNVSRTLLTSHRRTADMGEARSHPTQNVKGTQDNDLFEEYLAHPSYDTLLRYMRNKNDR